MNLRDALRISSAPPRFTYRSAFLSRTSSAHTIKTSKTHKPLKAVHSKELSVIHNRNLKQALENGVVLKKIHCMLEFIDAPWHKTYVWLNIHRGAQPHGTKKREPLQLK